MDIFITFLIIILIYVIKANLVKRITSLSNDNNIHIVVTNINKNLEDNLDIISKNFELLNGKLKSQQFELKNLSDVNIKIKSIENKLIKLKREILTNGSEKE